MITPLPAGTKEQSRRSSKVEKNVVIGTLSAFASACRLESDGEIWPFSIFDSMPPDSPAEAASSETVMPRRRRIALTCTPSACSSVRSDTEAAASERFIGKLTSLRSFGRSPAIFSALSAVLFLARAVISFHPIPVQFYDRRGKTARHVHISE